jgi:hypothetical protein
MPWASGGEEAAADKADPATGSPVCDVQENVIRFRSCDASQGNDSRRRRHDGLYGTSVKN